MDLYGKDEKSVFLLFINSTDNSENQLLFESHNFKIL